MQLSIDSNFLPGCGSTCGELKIKCELSLSDCENGTISTENIYLYFLLCLI